MEYRQLGRSGLKVSALSFGAATFGGSGEFFKAWGETGVTEATRLVSICVDAGVNLFDTANIYSAGLAEEILGKAVHGRRDKVLISTKGTVRMGDGPNNLGSSRSHLTEQLDVSSFTDAEQCGLASGGILSGHESKPCGKEAPVGELVTVTG